MRKSEIVVRLTLTADEAASVDRQAAESGHIARVEWVKGLVRDAIADEIKEFEARVKQRRSV